MKLIFKLMLLVAFVALPSLAEARNYGVSLEKATPEQAVAALKKETGMEFVYQKDLLKMSPPQVTVTVKDATLDQLLNRVVSMNMKLAYEVTDNTVVLRRPKVDAELVHGEIHGTVIDAELNEPLPGATVFIEGTTKYALTDIDGKFTFTKVDAVNPHLRVVYIGMKDATVRVSAKNKGNVRIDMQPMSTMMSEVVVTGYGDYTKEKMTGATATISADKLESRHTLNVLDNLEGRVAGLSTYGGKPVIRGLGSLRGSTNPLLVVDGLPVESSLDDINPYDIESVNVLKDAAAAAIYGARAANGIIVVTTKNAKKKGKVEVDFSTDITWYEKKNMDYKDNFFMNPDDQLAAECDYYEYKFFVDDGYKNNPMMNLMYVPMYMDYGMDISPIEVAYYRFATGQIDRDGLDSIVDSYKGNNYAKEYAEAMYRRLLVQQYNLSLRSSSDKSRNNLVVNFKHDNGGIINTKNDWLNVQYKGAFDVFKWLTATMTINSVYTNTLGAGVDYSSWSNNPWAYAPYMPFRNEDGSIRRYYGWYGGNDYYSVPDGFRNMSVDPVEEAYNNTMTTRSLSMRYHADLLFKIWKGLTAQTQFSWETQNRTEEQHATEESHAARVLRNSFTVVDPATGGWKYLTPENGGFLATKNRRNNYWTARGQINYNGEFGKHEVQAIAGLEFRETLSKGTKALSLGYDEQLQSSSTYTVDLGSLSQMRSNPYFYELIGGYPANQFAFGPYIKNNIGLYPEEKHRYASGYANATYTYDSRYNVFGSFRKDYADVFGLNSKFRGKPLWSVGAAWNIHNEEFMHEFSTWLNFLKLRFSYGVTGNIYQGATSVMTANAGLINDYTTLPYGYVTSPANPNLRWEQARTTNVGLDFSFLNYRLRGSFDFYNKEGKDIFNNINLDPTTGFTSFVANAASIRNQGIELTLGYDWFQANGASDFEWSTNLTFSYNRNTVTKVENDADVAYKLIYTPYKKGYPVNALWCYTFAGISDVDGQEGRVTFEDESGNAVTDIAMHSVDVLKFGGQSDPKYVGAMENTWRWRGLSLGITLAYYGGHKMRAMAPNETFAGFTSPLPSYFTNAWTPENPTNWPGIGRYASTALGSETMYVDAGLHDASFLKIRNIVLSYMLPQQWLRRTSFQNVNLRFQVNGLGAIWKANKVGVDPETLGIRQPANFTVGLHFNI